MAELSLLFVSPHNLVREVMACIDRNAKGIALVVDEERHLIGTVTDGDIRGAILAGIDLSTQVTELIEHKADPRYRRPITAPVAASEASLLNLMRQHGIRQIPLLDEEGRVVNLVTLEDLIPADVVPVTAVIMAGGQGRRLQPLTYETPKPMLPIGGRPVMEWIIEGLRQAGIRHIIVTTHYKAEVITQHFGNGCKLGVEIDYIHEGRLSGTAGALGLLDSWPQSLLVINGDIMTRVDFRTMFRYHQEQKADMTVAIREYHVQVPYGIVEMQNTKVVKLTEKPLLRFFVNAGIYLLEPSVQGYITRGEFLDMTDLMTRLLGDQRSLIGFPLREYWVDIGQQHDYEQAQEDMRNWGGDQ